VKTSSKLQKRQTEDHCAEYNIIGTITARNGVRHRIDPGLLLRFICAHHIDDVRSVDVSYVPFTRGSTKVSQYELSNLVHKLLFKCERISLARLVDEDHNSVHDFKQDLLQFPSLTSNQTGTLEDSCCSLCNSQLSVLNMADMRVHPGLLAGEITKAFPNLRTLIMTNVAPRDAHLFASLQHLTYLDIG
jgi:hypothetical protein